MARWKQVPEETYRFAVQSFFEPTDFLRTLQHWILFYVQDGETRKSVLRQHQRAIQAVLDRCADPAKTRGLIWHTQGSGKTFTLLTAAKRILEDKARFQNATVVWWWTAPSWKASSRAGSSGCSARCRSRTSPPSGPTPRPSCSRCWMPTSGA
jgi:hypothetical protein